MAQEVENLSFDKDNTCIEPNLVFEIEGINKVFSVIETDSRLCVGNRCVSVGEEFDGECLVIGDKSPSNNALNVRCVGDTTLCVGDKRLSIGECSVGKLINPVVSMSSGTTTSINQSLSGSDGSVKSIQTMNVKLIDKDCCITEMLSFDCPIGKAADFYLSLDPSCECYPDDYKKVFRGIITEWCSGAGWVTFKFQHPDVKKREDLFNKVEGRILTSIPAGFTGLVDIDTSATMGIDIPEPAGPLKTYIKLENDSSFSEMLEYTKISDTQINIVSRGNFQEYGLLSGGAWSIDDEFTVICKLEGNPIDLALNVMMSSDEDYYAENISINSVVAPNCIFLDGDLAETYGAAPGDTYEFVGALNLVSTEIVNLSYDENTGLTKLTTNGVDPLVNEPFSSGSIRLKTPYSVLGFGVGLRPSEINIAEYLDIKDRYFQSTTYCKFIDEEIQGKKLIEEEILLPLGVYSTQVNGRVGAGIFAPQLPEDDILTIDKDCIVKCENIKICKSINQNFYNVIRYRFDKDPCTGDYKAAVFQIDQDSRDKFGFTKQLDIDACGLRTELGGLFTAQSMAQRRLSRFAGGSEYIKGLQLTYRKSCDIDVGDLVELDLSEVNVSDTSSGCRDTFKKTFEVVGKNVSFKSGKVTVDLIDSGIDNSQCRLTSLSPSTRFSSFTLNGTASMVIDGLASHGNTPLDETGKWCDGMCVQVMSYDSCIDPIKGVVSVVDSDFNYALITIDGDFSSLDPDGQYYIALCDYDDVTEKERSSYSFLTDGENGFSDGGLFYGLI